MPTPTTDHSPPPNHTALTRRADALLARMGLSVPDAAFQDERDLSEARVRYFCCIGWHGFCELSGGVGG